MKAIIPLLFLNVLFSACQSTSHDSTGSIDQQWEKAFFGDDNDMPKRAVVLPEKKEIIILGQKFFGPEGMRSSCALLKIDFEGNQLKRQLFGTSDDRLTFIDHYKDGNLLLLGDKGEYMNRSLWMKVINSNFDIIKDTAIADMHVQDLYGPKFQKTKDGNIVVVYNSDKGVRVVKMNDKFEMLWTKDYKNEFMEVGEVGMTFHDFIIDSKENLVLVGSGQPFQKGGNPEYNYDFFLMKLNEKGDSLWRSIIGKGDRYYTGYSVTECGGNYFATGMSRDNDKGVEDSFDSDVYSFSPQGKLNWHTELKGSDTEYGIQVLPYDSTSILATGWTSSHDGHFVSDEKVTKSYVARLDLKGQIKSMQTFNQEGSDEVAFITPISGKQYLILSSGSSNNGGSNMWKVYWKKIE